MGLFARTSSGAFVYVMRRIQRMRWPRDHDLHLSTPPAENLMHRARFALALLAAAVVTRPAAAQSPDSTVGRRRIQALPAFGSAPETGVQYGATLFAVFEQPRAAHTRPSAAVAYAIRTAKSQTRIGMEGEHWTAGNARRYAGTLVWQKYPLPYYGIGQDAPESAKEIFTPSGIEAIASAQQRVRGSLYALSSLRFVNQTVKPDSLGALERNAITGNRGGRVVELTLGGLDDSRDNVFAPMHGRLVQLSYARSADAMGSEFNYGRLRLDARAYGTIRGSHVIAFQALAIKVDGTSARNGIPFDQLALVGGGDIMRGYARGRFRDRTFGGAQAEYRTPVSHRIGAVAFAGAGAIAPRASDLGSATLLPTYGAGLRVQIDPAQRTAVRADYGRGRDGNSGLYIGFNQAF